MDFVSLTWLMIYELRIDDRKLHFWDSDRTRATINQIYIRGVFEKELAFGIGYVRLGLVRLHYIIHQSFLKHNRCPVNEPMSIT